MGTRTPRAWVGLYSPAAEAAVVDCGAQAERLAYELTEAQRRAKSLQEALYREREAAIGHATSAAAAQSVPSSVTSVPLCPFPSHRSAQRSCVRFTLLRPSPPGKRRVCLISGSHHIQYMPAAYVDARGTDGCGGRWVWGLREQSRGGVRTPTAGAGARGAATRETTIAPTRGASASVPFAPSLRHHPALPARLRLRLRTRLRLRHPHPAKTQRGGGPRGGGSCQPSRVSRGRSVAADAAIATAPHSAAAGWVRPNERRTESRDLCVCDTGPLLDGTHGVS